MTARSMLNGMTPDQAVLEWLDAFEADLRREDIEAAAAKFLPDGHWRDLLAFTWHIETMNGTREIEGGLARTLAAAKPSGFHLPADRTQPSVVTRAGREAVEAIIGFDTAYGPANGVLRLVPDPLAPEQLRAWILLTALDQITGHEERIEARRPGSEGSTRDFGGENWQDLRNRAQAYQAHEPAVLVIGGGQAGLGIGACLAQLGVDALIIDRHARIGDAWRKRYHSLTLHNQVYINHMPYMPFPPNWPVYIPKDKLANWFEAYAESMELSVWGSTELVHGHYDERAERWTITLKKGEEGERVVRPRHIVFATGVSSIPVRPALPGLETFAGKVMHSAQYTDGHGWAGRKAIVLGTGNSGHDVAHDLHCSGAQVAMIQRSSTLIVSLEQAQTIYHAYNEGPPLEDCDLLATAMPYTPLVRVYQIGAAAMREADKELLDGLAARGFKLDFGPPDDTGYQMKYLRRGGGYYFNVGCSDLIVDGQIGLLQFSDIERFVAEGVRLKNGDVVEADLLVTATGYKNQQDVVRELLGDGVADRIGPVWGFDDGGEQRNMWRRTPQPGLWFTAGGLPHVRIYSKYLALQIKACEEGLLDLIRLDAAATPMDRSRPVREPISA